MKQQQKLSNEGSLSSNNPQVLDNTLECDGLDETFETVTSENMMADSSFNASLTTNMKMLMPHELGASNSVVGAASLVGQHSLHGSSSFYHHSVGTASNSNIVSGFNGFHNTTFSSYSPHNSLNGMGTTSSFSNLVHQQPITLSSNHSLTISSTMPPPLIPYHQPFYTSSSNILSTSTITATNEIENRQQNKTSENVNVNNKTTPVSEIEEQTGATSTDLITDENMEISNETGQETEEPEIDIVISNVVCAFSVRCHLSLKEIALHGSNVEYKRENGMVTMKLRKPFTTASIWSSGKVTCTGATSEEQAKIAARRTARMLQKLNFKVRFHNYRVVNVLGTCKMPWAIKIVQFSEKYKKEASYEPELHPGVTYNLKNPTATLKIFSTGSMTVTARSVADVQAAIEHIYPLVYEFKKPRATDETAANEGEIIAEIIETDYEEDDQESDDDDITEDPLTIAADDEPPNKKQKVHDISHLTKRYKGPAKRRPKRPLGKMNDPKQDLIYVSDGDVDGDDF